ncbi:MAG: hypothetical protein IH944_08310 [Armatimonadetes bacterium]|nr:hypothetical protein [Armatimonadota bacterium]
MPDYVRIGQMLIDKGLLTQEQMDTALEGRGGAYQRFGESLIEQGYVAEQDIIDCLADQYGLALVDLEQVDCQPSALRIFSESFAASRSILPVRIEGQLLHCVVSDPMDYTLAEAMEATHGLELVISLACPTLLQDAIEREYARLTA